MRFTALSITRGLCAGVLAASVGIWSGCSKTPVETPPAHPIAESYELLDHGDRAKAIALLEDWIAYDEKNDPGHNPAQAEEARVLLASAYAGEAGIDIFTFHDAFKDLLFSKSLESLLNENEDEPKQDRFARPRPSPSASVSPTPLEDLVSRMSVTLNTLRRTVDLLNMFPPVKESNWPLIERSLKLLDLPSTGKDLAYYRLFLRIAYLREFIVVRVLRDPFVGMIPSICYLNMVGFKEDLLWMIEEMRLATDDFRAIYPDKAWPLARVETNLKLTSDLIEVSEDPLPGASLLTRALGQSADVFKDCPRF